MSRGPWHLCFVFLRWQFDIGPERRWVRPDANRVWFRIFWRFHGYSVVVYRATPTCEKFRLVRLLPD